MRAGAKIDELALAIKADRLTLRNLFDPFCLIFLALIGKELDGAVTLHFLARDHFIAIDDLVHALLDLLEILGRERRRAGKIVIEAGIGRRAECDLSLGIELFHRLGHDMRRVVADDLERAGRIARQDRDLGVARDLRREVLFLTIDLDRNRCLGKAGADRGRELAAGDGTRKLPHRAIGQGDGNGRRTCLAFRRHERSSSENDGSRGFSSC